jgi:hypothetical protein
MRRYHKSKQNCSSNTLPLCVLQLQKSDYRSVTLVNLQFNTSGTYRCEVSTEAPNFETVAQNSNMTVMGKYHCNVVYASI